MSHLQITAIRLSVGGTRHEHITHVYGPRFGVRSRHQVVHDIKSGTNTFYVAAANGILNGGFPVVVIEPASALASQAIGGGAFIRTFGDDRATDDLLFLSRR